MVLVPRGNSGDERGNTDTSNSSITNSKKAVAAPATVSGEPKVQPGHWETGKAGPKKGGPREPGDLPARSPNRWTGRPYGAVFRSGDGNAGARAVRANLPRHSAHRSTPTLWTSASFASGFVLTRCVRVRKRNRRNVCHGEGAYRQACRCRARAGHACCIQQCANCFAANRCQLDSTE